jgi:hypothetical protein
MRLVHFTRRQLRHTACVALFAWVFGLVSGVANACLLQNAEPGAAAFSFAAGAQMAGCDSGLALCEHDAGSAEHHADSERGEPVQHGGKAVCLKFYADESSALAKSKASQADLPALRGRQPCRLQRPRNGRPSRGQPWSVRRSSFACFA